MAVEQIDEVRETFAALARGLKRVSIYRHAADQHAAFLEPALASLSRLLAREKLSTVVLVSQAWHLPRALWAFQRAGLTPLPWPVPRTEPTRYRIGSFLPSIGALLDTFYALHEMMGGAYYRLRY